MEIIKKTGIVLYANLYTKVAFVLYPDDTRYKARVRVRSVLCGKTCKRCPHGPYIYIQWREKGKLKEKYFRAVSKEEKQGGSFEKII